MASLGELTAGIAHEIQNPLNFVNNFSEVNAELIDEMQAELKDGNQQAATALSEDIRKNLEKINHHGKRADSIVKNMLLHSRKRTGQKEPTDINALADEYIRLSYHGLRAKDKTFNAAIHTRFDETLDKVPVVPQDMGRVFLNLYNNAFYAVQQKAGTAGPGYQPTVTLTTRKEGGKALITVSDNGTGIPDAVKEKIFQPFFTTKPAGEGTGLGLSMSYDIVKAHGGEMIVHSVAGQGSEFNIRLPINQTL
jgi:signal transduction histidine kinase